MLGKSLATGLFLAGVGMALPCAHAAEASTTLRDELVRTTQALMDALPTGDKTPWEQWVTDDAVIIDEFGRVASKADTIASLHRFPTGVTGSIDMRDPHAWLHGDSALLSVEEYERESYPSGPACWCAHTPGCICSARAVFRICSNSSASRTS